MRHGDRDILQLNRLITVAHQSSEWGLNRCISSREKTPSCQNQHAGLPLNAMTLLNIRIQTDSSFNGSLRLLFIN